ncbi:alpha/beta fold hydrolase [Mycolicibacterium mageritense]|uniref:alpha/beta fold hydrolase n=1 Tax=Mycolicibacterium mageritense TaxID=53462 RepID=UPI0011D4962F|nr:alpha/beta hydrolase [Mycolicibacterium mageritense]TXI59035.1 MAG: alpha/beta hydrolase [Mycolicibacterium mageritense]
MTTTPLQATSLRKPLEHIIAAEDGVRLACREYGSRHARRTVVMLHGLCLDQTTWLPQIRNLLAQWGTDIRIVTLDYRGHGKSQAAHVSTYTITQAARDLAHVIRVLNVADGVVFAGHSMGGIVALSYLAQPVEQRPIDPIGLVLAASSAGGLAERGLGRLLATPLLPPLAAIAATVPHRVALDTVRALLTPACRTLARAARLGADEHAGLKAAVATALTRTTPAAAIGYLASLRQHNQFELLRHITATTVIVSGGKDVITPAHHSAALAAGIPRSVHLCQPDAGHMLLHDGAAIVTDAINMTLPAARTPATRDA